MRERDNTVWPEQIHRLLCPPTVIPDFQRELARIRLRVSHDRQLERSIGSLEFGQDRSFKRKIQQIAQRIHAVYIKQEQLTRLRSESIKQER